MESENDHGGRGVDVHGEPPGDHAAKSTDDFALNAEAMGRDFEREFAA